MNDNYDLSKLVKNKPKKINSRRKGKTFERDIAKELNKRFNTTDFCPTPGSGAFATIHKLPDHIRVHGDLISPKNFGYTLECKAGYPKIRIGDLFNLKGDLGEFITQVKRDAKSAGSKWAVILKQNRSEIIVFCQGQPPATSCIKCFSGPDFYICSLEEWLMLPDSYFFVEESL